MMRPIIWQSPIAQGISFDNSSNGYSASDIQTAIEETQTNAPGKARVTIVTTFNGSVGANQWLGYNDNLPGNDVPIVLPFACILKEVTVRWQNTGVDGQLQIFKNGLVAPTNVVHTETFTNLTGGAYFTVNQSFAAGDLLRGRWIDTGDNPNDMAVVYFFLLV